MSERPRGEDPLPAATLVAGAERARAIAAIRRRGARKAAVGLAAALVAVLVIRLQHGSTLIAIPFAAVIGWVYFAVGLFQLLTARDDDRRGIGLTGLVFVIVVGGLGSLAGMLLAFPTRSHAAAAPAPAPATMDRETRALGDTLEGLSHATVAPAGTPAGSAGSAGSLSR